MGWNDLAFVPGTVYDKVRCGYPSGHSPDKQVSWKPFAGELPSQGDVAGSSKALVFGNYRAENAAQCCKAAEIFATFRP